MNKRKTKQILIALASTLLAVSSCSTGASRQRFDASALGGRAASRASPLHEDVNGFLPAEVFMKTRTQSFCVGYQFCLVDGRIYYKRLPPAGDAEKWRLLTKTGLPNSKKANFSAPRRIVEISADADALFALSDSGRLYRCYFDIKTTSRPLEWIDAFGWPDISPLELNDLVAGNSGWALGARRDQVLWYDDPRGNPHHFGTMGIETLYFLDPEGQGLRYADTGLPSDFSHGLLGPERGSFAAKAISASASTIFLIDEAGGMYTRLADFDTIGCDPMFFKYTYREESYGLPGSDYRSNFTPWALPGEDWRAQPPIPISGEARISSRITILQTGQGNAARELRVAGLSPEGKTGFYRKPIYGEAWSFREAKLELFPADFLAAATVASGKGRRGENRERSYAGSLFLGGQRDQDISFEIPDYPMGEGSCRLVAREGAESAEILLYPVEIWTYQKRYDPGADGTPRLFNLTLRLPRDGFSALAPEFRAKLESLFGGLDLELFSWRLDDTGDYLFLEPADADPDSADSARIFLGRGGEPILDMDLARRSAGYADRVVGRYLDPALDIRRAGELGVANRSKIERVVQLNREYRQGLLDELELFRAYRTSSGLSRWGYGAVDLLASVTFLNQIDFPKIKTMTSFGGRIMEANDRSYQEMAESREWIYAKLIELLDLRLAEYGKVIAAFDADELSAQLGPRYRESYLEYYQLAGFPAKMDGAAGPGRKRASLRLLDEMPLFPGLLLSMDKPSKKDPLAKSVLLVELKDSARAVYAAEPSKERPFKVKVEFHAVTPDGGFEDAKGDKSGSLEWDGRILRIWREGLFFSKELVFRGEL